MVGFWISFFRFSISAPFLPITIPGRAVAMRTVTRLLRRSISIEETPAWFRRPLTKPRMRRSSCSCDGNPFRSTSASAKSGWTPAEIRKGVSSVPKSASW